MLACANAAVWLTAPIRGESGSALLPLVGRAASGKAAYTAFGLVACTARPPRVSSAQLHNNLFGKVDPEGAMQSVLQQSSTAAR